MCTVTYIPLHQAGYILTSSRDEQTTRPVAKLPSVRELYGHSLVYPEDPKGGGTWIAGSDDAATVCLFNGAFKPHLPKYPYRHSRGAAVLDFFSYKASTHFINEYDFTGLEPFTLVIIESDTLRELKWDGKKIFLLDHDFRTPKIWSSVTLYNPEVIRLREHWFKSWGINLDNPSQMEIIDFHLHAGSGDKINDIQMERRALSLRTVSITSIMVCDAKLTMRYLDLQGAKTAQVDLDMKIGKIK